LARDNCNRRHPQGKAAARASEVNTISVVMS
jgi:hypothetical protein